jgi:Mg2+/Co2+ transporter CorB
MTTKKEIITIQKTKEHPLEEVFDIEPCTTETIRTEQRTELVEIDEYDEKDTEIEDAFQEVFDKAMSTYEIIQDEIEDIEGKFKARMMEVGNQHLNTALAAAREKAKMKADKDKLKQKQAAGNGPKTVNNNLIMSREDLLKTLFQEGEE